MKLTLLDIRRQQFAKKTFGGYDADEVDGFVKQIAEQWEEMLDDARAASDRATELETKLRHYERVEMALQEALETARETGRRAESMAEQKAKMIVEEAEMRARQILQEAERERHGARQDLVRLTSRQTEIGARLRGFLLSELEILAQYQGDDPVGFIKLQPAHAPASLEAPREAGRLGVLEDRLEADEETDEASGEAWAPEADDRAAADSFDADDATASYQDRPVQKPSVPPASEPAPSAHEAPSSYESPRPAPAPDPTPAPTSEAPRPDPSWPDSAAVPPASAAPASSEAPAWAPDVSGAPAPAWNLRSLVTGEGDNVAGSEAERERIRRILDDLD